FQVGFYAGAVPSAAAAQDEPRPVAPAPAHVPFAVGAAPLSRRRLADQRPAVEEDVHRLQLTHRPPAPAPRRPAPPPRRPSAPAGLPATCAPAAGPRSPRSGQRPAPA